MSLSLTTQCLQMLASQKDFKITGTGQGTIKLEADGASFDGSFLWIEEALIEGTISILAEIRARELVLKAKVTL